MTENGGFRRFAQLCDTASAVAFGIACMLDVIADNEAPWGDRKPLG